MAFQVLLHGIIVANKDVAAKNFIPRKRLRCRQSLKPLVNIHIHIIIIAVLVVVVAQLLVSNNIATVLVNLHVASTLEVVLLENIVHVVVNTALHRSFAHALHILAVQVQHVEVKVVVVLETKLVGWPELRVGLGEIEVVHPFPFHPSLLSELGCDSGPFVIL